MDGNQSNRGVVDKLIKTILVGLPATGKTTLSNELYRLVEEKFGVEMESVSSDLKFRAVRKNPNHPVVKNFMKNYNIPTSDFPLLIKTNDFIEKYGEPTFRDLESNVVIDMLENGEFDGKIPDLGGKTMLHPKTAEAFKKRGYTTIYLKSSLKLIAEHITRDFEAMNDGATITRTPINAPIMKTLKRKFPDIAEQSPKSYFEKRRDKYRRFLLDKKYFARAVIKMRKERLRYEDRLKERDSKAFEVISKRYFKDNPLYENVADVTVYLTDNLKDNVKLLCSALGVDCLSAGVQKREASLDLFYQKGSKCYG